jgi:hypothetical protein
MIEVRSSYLVKMKDVNQAITLWRQGRDSVWPELGWSGRPQQMLHGYAQQSLFVWSSEWASMAAWEEGMARTRGNAVYKAWSDEMNQLRVYGSEREVFTILEPYTPPDNTPGKVEVRSSYLVQIQNVRQAQESARRGQETLWPEQGWTGQYQQMLHGKNSQSQFVWSAVWDNLGTWERAMANTSGPAFQTWFTEWKGLCDFGGPREIFRNL